MDGKRRASEIAGLERELERKVGRRDELNKQIFEVQHRIIELRKPMPFSRVARKKLDLSGVGLIEAICILLQNHGQSMTEAEVLHGLTALGFDVKRFKSPASAVHNTLLRMASRRQLRYRGEHRTYELVAESPQSSEQVASP